MRANLRIKKNVRNLAGKPLIFHSIKFERIFLLIEYTSIPDDDGYSKSVINTIAPATGVLSNSDRERFIIDVIRRCY